MASIEELRAKATRRRVEVKALINLELLEEHERLEARLFEVARGDVALNRPVEATELAAELGQLETRMAEEEDTYVFEGIGTTAWYELVAEHPPTDEQRATGHDSNWMTFQPAAIAVSCVDPKLALEDAEWLRSALPVKQWAKLWAGCMLANVGADARPKSGLASTIQQLSRRSPVTSVPEGSLAEPSSVVNGVPSPPASTTTTTA